MCSIIAAIAPAPQVPVDRDLWTRLRANAADRGRDGGREEWATLPDGRETVLACWRATPTTEVAQPTAFGPYGGVVHNGTIANDAALGGAPEGLPDSAVLPTLFGQESDRVSFPAFVERLGRVVGSYALVVRAARSLWLATNYKPLHYWRAPNGVVYVASMARHFAGVAPWGQAPVTLEPYTALDLAERLHLSLYADRALQQRERRALVICSGGLDSTVAATMLARDGYEVCLFHVDYGCRASTPETTMIPAIASNLGAHHAIVSVPFRALTQGGDGGPLLDGRVGGLADGVAGAEYAHEWVPARNVVLHALAVAYAEAHGYGAVASGINLEEAGAYPDNEEQFIHLLDRAAPYMVQNGVPLRIGAPVGHLMKHEIVREGLRLHAPLAVTWSCYEAGFDPCGACGPCTMRAIAFARCGAEDPALTPDARAHRRALLSR
jgi:7-cyano-7-deazaguanine synthase